jgi:nitrogen regulatory protein PII
LGFSGNTNLMRTQYFPCLDHNTFLACVIITAMVGEKMTLPFEVSYSEKPSKQSKGMKRLAIIVKPENVDGMISSLREMGLEATIYDVKGAGKDKQKVASGRGSGTFELAYTSRKVVATVVKSDDVDAVVERMKSSLAGEKAVVMISQVDDLVMI